MSNRRLSMNFPFILLAVVLCAAFVLFLVQGARDNRRAEDARRVRAAAPAPVVRDQQRLQKFKLTGFDEKGKTAWNLEGDAAEIDARKTVVLEQNVTLRLRDQTVVRTDKVRWSQEGGELVTDAVVTVDHEDAHVVGRGAHGRPNDGFIQLHRDIVMNLKGGTRVSCEGPLKIYYNENRMVFYRKVVIVDDRGTLSSNRMDVYFDPDDRKVKEIVAEGNVAIERGGDRTRSRRAIYSVRTGSVRLEGNPEITLTQTQSGVLDGFTGNPLAS